MATSTEYPGPGVTPAYQQQPYSLPPMPPSVPKSAYQHGYQQAQYQPLEATATAAAEVTDEKAKSDTGIDTPGIPEQYLNVSLN